MLSSFLVLFLVLASVLSVSLAQTTRAPLSACNVDKDCSGGYLCVKNCNGTGACVKQTQCSLAVSSVCGCDGKTYTNLCNANLVGRTQARKNGTCESTSVSSNSTSELPPGAVCSTDANCRSDLYCRKVSCNDATGLCSFSSTLNCGSAYQPVCGCDGITYQNPCAAYGKRQSLQYLTPCTEVDTRPRNLSCFFDVDCLKTEYCRIEVCQDQLNVPGRPSGQCVSFVDSCDSSVDPVCTCNGQTYVNSCYARLDRQVIRFSAPCSDATFSAPLTYVNSATSAFIPSSLIFALVLTSVFISVSI